MSAPRNQEHAKTLSRLNACNLTLCMTLAELTDPKDPDLRADLVIELENILNVANALRNEIAVFTWSQLDRDAHPSGEKAKEDPRLD